MLKKLFSAVAALALAGLVTTAASAQDSTAMKAGMAKPTYQTFVTAVEATPVTIRTLRSRPAITAETVTLVSVRDLSGTQPDSSVVVLLQPHHAQIQELRTYLGTQSAFTGMLREQSPVLTTEDIVAVAVQDDGNLLVFYRPTK